MEDTLFKSSGVLSYSHKDGYGYRLVLNIDPGITKYYRALLPKSIRIAPQLHPAHISVVRKEIPVNLNCWGIHEGEEVEFYYSNIIYSGKVYYWLNAFSTRLEEIKRELGLPVVESYSKHPSDQWIKVFHVSIGNIKSQI